MEDELTHVAALAGRNTDVVDKLDELLVGPNDRAYVVCSLLDCKLNIKGRCTIYAVLDVPRMKTGQPCDKYLQRESTE
ncbi:MAG: hypothetical protein A2075_20385 [Geobacteraceae bacterium GWC2_58_44]|nr:MAG: hypothetical protein A2075_20385 [Geobacteraceae bacterium GWC2_58_44]HBG04679.1 hypothetical protein [Geobacter sp.]